MKHALPATKSHGKGSVPARCPRGRGGLRLRCWTTKASRMPFRVLLTQPRGLSVELHFGRGYLVAGFLSFNASHRTDEWGGDLDGRMRLALGIAGRVRAAWPAHKPLFCRLLAVDGSVDCWSLDDSIVLARELAQRGVDAIVLPVASLKRRARCRCHAGWAFRCLFRSVLTRTDAGLVAAAPRTAYKPLRHRRSKNRTAPPGASWYQA